MTNPIDVATGVQLSWHYNQQIAIYKLNAITSTSLQEWSDYVISLLEESPKDKPYLVAHDISQSGLGLLYSTAVSNDIFNIGILPETRDKVESILNANPEWQVRLGLIVSASLSGRLARVLFQKNDPNSQIQFKAFFYQDPAIEWLIGTTTQ